MGGKKQVFRLGVVYGTGLWASPAGLPKFSGSQGGCWREMGQCAALTAHDSRLHVVCAHNRFVPGPAFPRLS